MLELTNISCEKGSLPLFTGLACSLQAGDLLHVTGTNGSGKTTLLKILAGLNREYTGTLHWQGEDVRAHWAAFAPCVLYLGHQPALKAQLTARENLHWYARCSGEEDPAVVDAALTTMGLSHRALVPSHQLSAGQQRRTVLARLLFSPQTIWVLDEPFTALDVAGFAPVISALETHLRRGGIAILTTHHGTEQITLPHRTLAMGDYTPQRAASGI
jgi:heme exporter protein A